MIPLVGKSGLFATLPPAWPQDPLPGIRAAVSDAGRKIIVLDDDPTGTQTVHDVPVLMTWDAEALRVEFQNAAACFYILTNSRSLAPEAAAALNREIAVNLASAAADARKPFDLVSRSDSTLRGHFPLETGVLAEILGPFDGLILCPFFEAGGRFTINDIHYVAEGEALIPAAETPFARDAAFGYRSSNLRDWVAEKSGGAVTSQSVMTISLEDIRRGGPDAVRERLIKVSAGQVCVVNAACQRDIEVFVQGLLAAEKQGRSFLFRTAASFVAARLGLAVTGGSDCHGPDPACRRIGTYAITADALEKLRERCGKLEKV